MDNKGLANSFYRDYIIDYLTNFKKATRQEINQLIYPRLPLTYSYDDKNKKVQYLLTSLRQKNKIKNIGSDTKPIWTLK